MKTPTRIVPIAALALAITFSQDSTPALGQDGCKMPPLPTSSPYMYAKDLSKYKVGALTIEHNFEEPKRSQIRRLLESNGYRFVLSLLRDDFYVIGASGAET